MSEEQKNQEEQPVTQEQQAPEEVVENPIVDESEVDAGIDLGALDLAKQLKEAQDEVASLKDQMLRAVADAQNIKRRAEQDVSKAHKFGTEKFVNEMLPIVDSLERALESKSDDEATKAMYEGVEMTLSMFVSGLAKFNVEQVNPQGEAFDPALHQAMSMVDGGEVESNTVVTVMQKGYTMSDRLLRPALVMVAK
ncbi:MAG: nucleotide exchange factor GrpE [Pseudomonadales bacterium]